MRRKPCAARGDLTIVAEDGAKFTLQSLDKNGGVDSVDLQSKAVLVDAPKQQGKRRFQVTTPQAIAAVRGTKWAVDAQETRTSVLVLRGQVAVRRPSGAGQVVLGPGDGVDVDPGTAATGRQALAAAARRCAARTSRPMMPGHDRP